jgi:VWFA-related protein
MLRAAALSIAAVSALAGAAFAQETQEPQRGPFGEEIRVSEVLLDVLVTDKQGNVVVGLGPEDFVVKEDGAPVDLTGVTFYSSSLPVEDAKALAAKGIRAATVPEDRYFILFFDDQKRAALDAPFLITQQMEANQRARDWVKELAPNDWVAVVSWDYKLKVHQDFTRDKQAIVNALGAAMKGKDRGNWPSRTQGTTEGPSLLANLPKGNELRNRTTRIYDALEVVAEAAGGIRGRKNLLLFTVGFGNVNNFGQYTPDLRYYPDMVDALNDNNVAVYTVDLTPEGIQTAFADSMHRLADDTGGQYLFNFVNFLTPLRRVAEENTGYYLLSYRSEHPAGKSGFQKVEVDTANPEFRVRAREGYEYGS